jgi:hypothetical protein
MKGVSSAGRQTATVGSVLSDALLPTFVPACFDLLQEVKAQRSITNKPKQLILVFIFFSYEFNLQAA